MFFKFEQYYKKKLPKYPIFIDVGANEGLWSNKIVKKYKKARVFAIEPIEGITKKKKNILVFNFAIHIKNKKKMEFNITRKNVTSSILKQNHLIIKKFKTFKAKNGLVHRKSDYDVIKKIYIKTITLKNFCMINKIKNIHYLKIDAEGNDLNVLKSLGKKYTKKLWGLELETWNEQKTLWKNQIWLQKCLDYIKKINFTVVKKIIHGKGKTTDLICVNNKILKNEKI